MATFDFRRGWRRTDAGVRVQGKAFANHIWYFTRWSASHEVATIDWTGMTDDDKNEARSWSEERKKHTEAEGDTEDEEDEQRMKNIYRECRGGCGAQNTELRCSKCRRVCAYYNLLLSQRKSNDVQDYCSSECQREDWTVSNCTFPTSTALTTRSQYHKSVCGKMNEIN